MNTLNTKNNFKTSKIGEAIYVYNGNTLIASYTKQTGRLYTYNLSKADKRKVIKVIKKALLENEITKSQAKEFYRNLCRTVNGDSNKDCCGIMPVELIADNMGISIKRASKFCDAMVRYGITERSDGMIIV